MGYACITHHYYNSYVFILSTVSTNPILSITSKIMIFKKEKRPIALGIPRRSPIQILVLSRNRCFPHLESREIIIGRDR